MAKRTSRADQWADAVAQCREGIDDLVSLQSEYQEWLDGLPDNLQDGPVAEKLNAVCDLDLSGVSDTIAEAESVELPLGFGRD